MIGAVNIPTHFDHKRSDSLTWGEAMEQYRSRIEPALLSACRQALDRFATDFAGRRVFGFVLAPDSGFVSFALAVGLKGEDEIGHSQRLSPDDEANLSPDLKERLAEIRGAEPDTNAAVAAEWQNYGTYSECFDPVYDLITPLFDEFYEDYEPHEISDFFERISTDVLLTLKADGAFQSDLFENDVLLGVQFADPDNAERVIRVSKHVNSAAWHKQVLAYFGYYAAEQIKARKRRPAKKAVKKTRPWPGK